MGVTVIDTYLDHCRQRNLRPTYIDGQRLELARLHKWLRTLDVELLAATTADLVEYLDRASPRSGAKLSAPSRGVAIAHLRGFYGWALDTDQIVVDPSRKLVRPRQSPRLPRPMPDDDVARALAEAPCTVALILNLAVFAGLRACEIAQLRAEDVQANPPLIVVRESKGGGMSTVGIAPMLADVFARCPLPATGWLFPHRDGKHHVSRSRICQLANVYLKTIGISHTLHSLRHTYGTHLYRNTHDLRLTQEMMRHRSIQSTVGYTKLDPASQAAALAQLRFDL